MPGIECGSSACKASAPPTVLCLQVFAYAFSAISSERVELQYVCRRGPFCKWPGMLLLTVMHFESLRTNQSVNTSKPEFYSPFQND